MIPTRDPRILAMLSPATRALFEACHAGRGREQVRFQVTLQTHAGAHGMRDKAALEAKREGLEVDVTTAGGWFTKQHLFVVRGPAEAVAMWAGTLELVMKSS